MRREYVLSSYVVRKKKGSDTTVTHQWKVTFPYDLAIRSGLREGERYMVKWEHEAPGVFKLRILGKKELKSKNREND